MFPGDPCCRDAGYGDYQPLPVASFGIFLNEMLHAARKTPNLPIFSCSASVLEREHRVDGSVCAAVPALMCCEVLCADKRARLCRGVGWPAGLWQEPASCVREQGGAQGHLASSIAQRQPGSRAGRQDTALDLLQGLLSLHWSLHLASWHLRCARVALQRLCPVQAGPVTGLGGHWESSLQQRQGLSCSPTTATATGTDFF